LDSRIFKISFWIAVVVGTKVKVVKVGNSLRIAIPMPLAEALEIKAGDYLDLEVKGHSLSIELKK
jgi:AbrB family looped-hinge helix DNA binding protein